MATPKIELRVPDEQRARWQACADRAHVGLSEWIRWACDQAVGQPAQARVEIKHATIPVEVVDAVSKPHLHAVPAPAGGKRTYEPDPRPSSKPSGKKRT